MEAGVSRRNKKRREQQKQKEQKEREFLSASVHPLGIGEDPAIAALLQSDAPGLSHREKLERALAVQRIAHGDAAYLNDPEAAETVSRLRQLAAKMDEADAKFRRDPEKFADEVTERALKKIPPKKLDDLRAKGARMYQEAYQQAVARKHTKALEQMWRLRNDPQEEIEVSGHWVTPAGGGPILLPDEVRISGLPPIILKPGIRKVPKIVADMYRQMRQTRLMGEEVHKAAVIPDDDKPSISYQKLSEKIAEIERRFGQQPVDPTLVTKSSSF